MSSALDDLREAAKVLRERAEAATPGPWRTEHHSEPDRDLEHYLILGVTNRHQVTPIPLRTMTEDAGFYSQAEADVTYGATMHPGVGLALADWLDAVAVRWIDNATVKYYPARATFQQHALTVARLILGRADG